MDEDKLGKIHTKDNTVDMLTKALSVGKFEHFSNLVHLKEW